MVANDDTGDRYVISFFGDTSQVLILIIRFLVLHIRLTRGCIVDNVVVICSRWFMEV